MSLSAQIRQVLTEQCADRPLPEHFYVGFNLKQAYPSLKAGRFDGMYGVSESESIAFSFAHQRDPGAILKMPAKGFVERNPEAVCISYASEEQMFANQASLLRRVFSGDKSSSIFDSIARTQFISGLEELGIVNKGDAIKMAHKTKFSGAVSQYWKFDTPMEFAQELVQFFSQKAGWGLLRRKLSKLSDSDLEAISRKVADKLMSIGANSQHELEWHIPSGHVYIPEHSKLMVISGSKHVVGEILQDPDLQRYKPHSPSWIWPSE